MGPGLARFTCVLFLTALACGCTLQSGLANAPQLGGAAVADPRVHDVITNGHDSCGRKLDPGPLRGRIPACPLMSSTLASPRRRLSRDDQVVVMPWDEFIRARWRCPWLEEEPTDPTRATASIGHPAVVAFSLECRGIEHQR